MIFMEQTINQNQPVSQAPVSNPPPVSQPKKSSLPVLLVVLLVVLIGGSFLLGKSLSSPKIVKPPVVSEISPIPKVTTIISPVTETTPGAEIPVDWKTYRNEKYGFEFRYPTEWIASADKVQSVDYKADHGLLEGADFFITINPTNKQTLEQISEQTKKDQPNAHISKLEFLGFDALLVSIPSNQEMGQYWPSKTIYFEKEGNTYSLTSETYGPKMDLYRILLDQILSTFKFLP